MASNTSDWIGKNKTDDASTSSSSSHSIFIKNELNFNQIPSTLNNDEKNKKEDEDETTSTTMKEEEKEEDEEVWKGVGQVCFLIYSGPSFVETDHFLHGQFLLLSKKQIFGIMATR